MLTEECHLLLLLLPVQEEEGEHQEGGKEEDLAVLHAAMLDDNRCREETSNSLRGANDAWRESEIASERGKARFGVGDMVDARYLGGKDWFPATITKVGR